MPSGAQTKTQGGPAWEMRPGALGVMVRVWGLGLGFEGVVQTPTKDKVGVGVAVAVANESGADTKSQDCWQAQHV